MSIEAIQITKNFGKFAALKGVSLKVRTGELTALLGPSGSGKTTLLRIIAGLEAPDSGEIRFFGEDATRYNARQRGIGFVFQHYALFRHMTVFENVAFGLRVRPWRQRPTRPAIQAKVDELIRLVQLEGMAGRYPSQLSGGQRQRVALARALAVEPKVLLLDEPFGALDAKVRQELRRWLRRLHDELHITSLFVTHDQEEALEVADYIAVMNQGQIEQEGAPEDVYDHPKSPFVYQFLGSVNLFHGRVDHGEARMGAFRVEAPEHAGASNSPAVGYVRPHDLEVTRQANGTTIAASVLHVSAVGPTVRVELRRQDNGELIEAELTRDRFGELGLEAGEPVFVKPRRLKLFLGDDYSI